jgi:DNA-binding transcriptional ArsR family regulator
MSEPAYVTVEAGLLEAKHRDAMGGETLWTFLLLCHWQTGADGSINGGRPLDTRLIGDRLGLSDRAIRRHLDILEKGGYVARKRSRHGIVVSIAKPKKRLPRTDDPVRSDSPTTDALFRSQESRTDDPVRQNGRSCPNTPYKRTRKTEMIDSTKVESFDGAFDQWWKAYPRKSAKPAARTAFQRVVLKGKPPQGATASDFDGLTTSQARLERLTANTPAWAREYAQRPPDKIPHPATFLNRLDWVAEPQSQPGNGAAPRLRRSWE